MTITPLYNITNIRLSIGDHEFNKGLKLNDEGKVYNIEEQGDGWTAIVSGTQEYHVRVQAKSWDRGFCNCYLGERDELCKHMIALAIAVVKMHNTKEEEFAGYGLDTAYCSGEIREISDEEYDKVLMDIRSAMKDIRSYDGPSSTWFAYQRDLQKGSRLILLLLSRLPICKKSVDIIIQTLSRLDKKLLEGGVDDSDGTVGGAMEQMIDTLCLMSDLYPLIVPYILKKMPAGQIWDWDRIYRNQYGK